MEEEQAIEVQQATGSSRYLRSIVLLLVLMVGIFLGRYIIPGGGADNNPQRYVSVNNGERQLTFPTFWQTLDALQSKYIGQVDQQQLFYGAVRGMVAAVGDPYTAFSDPDATKQFEETIGGSFSGVGIEIGLRQGLVIVIAPLSGSPAEGAGVREGDIIVAIDDEPFTQETTLDSVVNKIRGRKGTDVKLTVIHQGEQSTQDLAMTRDTIKIESVKSSFDNDIAHITITSFNSDTATRFATAAREADRRHVKGIIVDVRNNPGGFLQTAVDIASLFLDKGTLVVSERGKENKEYNATGNNLLKDVPVVVLINEGSASASEILAGALHDRDGGLLVGKKSFGKGSVQEMVKLDDGSSLRVTVAKWYTPDGVNINENGIEPDVEVDQNYDTPEDEQLQRAQEEIVHLIEQE